MDAFSLWRHVFSPSEDEDPIPVDEQNPTSGFCVIA